MNKPENIDQYYSQFTPEYQDKMRQLHQLVKETVPDALEVISYGMPAFKLNGRHLIYYAATKNHLGFYPAGTSTVDTFKNAGYEVTKGSVHFPWNQPLPEDLLKKMIKVRANENLVKKKGKG